jgi:hypothetical protein
MDDAPEPWGSLGNATRWLLYQSNRAGGKSLPAALSA